MKDKTSAEDSLFEHSFQVRDYECDSQGIVNNAVYQHYFEHARHQFLKAKGVNFNALVKEGIFLVIYRAEIDYFFPLTTDDCFTVSVSYQRLSKIRAVFEQKIRRNNQEITYGKFYFTTLNKFKKAMSFEKIDQLKALIG